MEGIEKITARIIEDAEREIAQMQRENEEKIFRASADRPYRGFDAHAGIRR